MIKLDFTKLSLKKLYGSERSVDRAVVHVPHLLVDLVDEWSQFGEMRRQYREEFKA